MKTVKSNGFYFTIYAYPWPRNWQMLAKYKNHVCSVELALTSRQGFA